MKNSLDIVSDQYKPFMTWYHMFSPHCTVATLVKPAYLQMARALGLLVTTHSSPLERNVDYVVPENDLLLPLLHQLERLQALWQEFDR